MPTAVWGRLRRGDRIAVGILVVVVAGVSLLPTAFGRPLMNGDNLVQNYPLRVLAGQVVREGHLPLWNGWIFSGTPLLAGWNAGAAFPTTWLFAILPDIWAWAINLLVVGLLATLGTYVFLRRQPIGPTGAFIGSATFAFTGFMSGQSVHFGLVLGMSLLPILLIAVDEIARRLVDRPVGDLLAPALLLSAAGALVVLAGEPRAISNDAIVVGIYALAWCWRDPSRAIRLLMVLAAAGCLALALSALQWLPGLQFLRASQRGAGGYVLYSLGSVAPSWSVFFLLPYLLGGYGNFGLATFSGPLNLPELSFGVGILPLVAFISLLPEALRRGSASRLGVWYVLALTGVILALGTNTPFGHVLWHVPLFGSQRLQNRNMGITDFALAVLVAFWADRLATDHESALAVPAGHGVAAGGHRVEAPEHSVNASGPRSERAARWASALPAIAVVVVVAVYLAVPVRLEKWLQVVQLSSGRAHQLAGYLIPACVLAVAVGAFALVAWRLSPRLRQRLLVGLAVVEITFLAANGQFALAPAETIATTNPETAQLAALIGNQGRYALYDPYFYVAPSTQPIAEQLGFFDLGILHKIASVQGYESAISALYEAATGTHQVGNLSLGAISGTTGNVLDLRALLTSPLYLAHPLPDGAAIPILTERGPRFDVAAGEKVLGAEAAAQSGPWLVLPGTFRSWFLPRPVEGAKATFVLDPTVRPQPGKIAVAFVNATGRSVEETAIVSGTRAQAAAPAGFDVVGVRVSAPLRGLTVVLGGVVVASSDGSERQLLDGVLQTALSAPHWRFEGMIGPLPTFVNTESRGPTWIVRAASGNPDSALVPGATTATSVSPAGDEMRTVVTTPSAALLVRSTAFAPGWYAEVQPASRTPAGLLAVHALGTVQAVRIPAGRSVVTWLYRPTTARVGALSTFAATLVFIALCALAWFRRRARAT